MAIEFTRETGEDNNRVGERQPQEEFVTDSAEWMGSAETPMLDVTDVRGLVEAAFEAPDIFVISDAIAPKSAAAPTDTTAAREQREAIRGPGKTHIRRAEEKDLDRLAEVDLMMFDSAYGEEPPSHAEVRDMLARRLENIKEGGTMLVCEVDGEINAFSTYFRTNKPWEDFTSWEHSTKNGTLDGIVEPDGKYLYAVNMTVTPRGSEVRAMQKVLANLFSSAMKEGIEYGYFVSRVPQLTKWLADNGIDYNTTDPEQLDALAEQYVGTTKESKKGKEEAYDYELRTYDRAGFERGKLVKGGFSDAESLNYGVAFKVDVPLAGKPKSVRWLAATGLSLAARSTKIAAKLF
ncbi:MAG TPA: hypothetical protein VK694_01390 [Verrucomicrobiae bacterium]|nr:hypothetical protein [Verrucomicrobiae bacterium]